LIPFDAWVDGILKRAPGGAHLAAAKDRLASFADQGFQGLGNIIAAALFAHALSRENFAAMGVAIGIYYFVAGLHRAAMVLPFIVTTARPGGFEIEDRRAWFWLNAAVVAATSVAIVLVAGGLRAVAGTVSPQARLFGDAMMLTAVMTPLMLTAEFGRRLLYQSHLTASAALASLAQFVGIVGAALLAQRLHGGLEFAALGWALGGAAATGIGVLVLWPGRPGGWRRGVAQWLDNPRFVFWQTLNHVPYTIANSSLVVVVGAFGGAAAAAAFNVARTLANPAIAVVSAVDALDKPRAARALAHGGLPAMLHSIRKTRALLVLLTGGYLLVIVALAQWIVPAAFGPNYHNAILTVRILAAAFFIICLNQPSESLLIVLGESRMMFATRVLAALVTVAGLALAAPYGPSGAAIAVAVAQVVNLGGLMGAELYAQRRFVARGGKALT
jgi:O-antigen/teichoic acid export membrane protein